MITNNIMWTETGALLGLVIGQIATMASFFIGRNLSEKVLRDAIREEFAAQREP